MHSKLTAWERVRWALDFEDTFPFRVSYRRLKKWANRDRRQMNRDFKRVLDAAQLCGRKAFV